MKYIIFLLAIALLFNSCDTSQIECIRVSANIVTESRELEDFQGVVFNHVGNVVLSQGPEYAFSIKGPDNVLELTKTTIENGLLVIGTSDCFNGGYNLEVKITSPIYNAITLAGQGKIISNGQIRSKILEVEMLGIGSIEANILADTLFTAISGKGSIRYEGQVIRHYLMSSREFSFNGFSMITDYTDINLTGIGDCEVMATKSLMVDISGEGDVYYKGTPAIESNISGKGEIIDSN